MGSGTRRGRGPRRGRGVATAPAHGHVVGAFLSSRPAITCTLVAAGIAATALATHAAGGTRSAVPQLGHLFVVIAAVTLGPGAGAVAGLGAGMALGPSMPLDVAAATAQDPEGWLVRMTVFVVVGTVTGALARGVREADTGFQKTLEDVPTAVIAATGVHADAIVTFTNSRAVSLLGDIVGRTLEDTARTLQARASDGLPIADILVNEQRAAPLPLDRFPTRISLVDPVGRRRHVRLRTLRTTRGRTVAALEDLTEEVRIERARHHLVTLAGHHLRTPLTPVVGLAPLIARHAATTGDDLLAEYARVLQRNANRLRHVVERLTELTDLEVAPLHAYQQVSVQSLVEDAARSVTDEQVRPGLEPSIVATGADEQVHVVPHHVHKALVELLSNALRHGRPPIVLDTATPGEGTVDIWVRDDGPGLPPTVASADVFLPFASMTEDPELDAPRGQGLGLALARAHCEATGAQLSYERPNRFGIRMPTAPPQPT